MKIIVTLIKVTNSEECVDAGFFIGFRLILTCKEANFLIIIGNVDCSNPAPGKENVSLDLCLSTSLTV